MHDIGALEDKSRTYLVFQTTLKDMHVAYKFKSSHAILSVYLYAKQKQKTQGFGLGTAVGINDFFSYFYLHS